MIPDVLFDAIEDIRKYLSDPETRDGYKDDLAEIEDVIDRMQRLQRRLDDDWGQPGNVPQGSV